MNTHRWIEDLLSIYGSLISEQIKFVVSQVSLRFAIPQIDDIRNEVKLPYTRPREFFSVSFIDVYVE